MYRCFASDGVLLYIGCTVNPEKRWGEQLRWEAWGPLVADHTVEWYPNAARGLAAEMRAIREEKPLLNRAGLHGSNNASVVSPTGEVVLLQFTPGRSGWVAPEALGERWSA